MEKEKSVQKQGVNALEVWMQESGVKLTQVNGQRRYGGPPPDWSGPTPGPGCEVFISQIPRNVYEDRLIPLFQRVGPLYEFRLMMNFSGQNRGFAYAKYGEPRCVEAAIRALHRHPLQDGTRLAVRRSTEKRQLCLGELPTSTERARLLEVLQNLTDGVEAVSLKFTKGERHLCALVLYTSHYAASMAKKVLCEAFMKSFGVGISVKWQSAPSTSRQDTGDPPDASLPLPPGLSVPRCRSPVHVRRPPPKESVVPLRRSPPHPSPPHPSPPRPSPAWLSRVDAALLLERVCQLQGVGSPCYHTHYLCTSPDGFLYFSFRVSFPSLPLPYTGVAQVLPATSTAATQEEIRRAAAEHVLKALF